MSAVKVLFNQFRAKMIKQFLWYELPGCIMSTQRYSQPNHYLNRLINFNLQISSHLHKFHNSRACRKRFDRSLVRCFRSKNNSSTSTATLLISKTFKITGSLKNRCISSISEEETIASSCEEYFWRGKTGLKPRTAALCLCTLNGNNWIEASGTTGLCKIIIINRPWTTLKIITSWPTNST